MPRHVFDRRSFLELSAFSMAGLTIPELVLRDPYRLLQPARLPGTPVRVRGQVSSNGRGVPRVAVSDGHSVVATAADGVYELFTTVERPFVMMSIPSGYAIPENPAGTARFYQRLAADAQGEMEASFELQQLETRDDRHVALLLADIQTEDSQEMQWFHEQTVPDVQQTIASLGGLPVVGIACGDIMFDNLELYPDYERGVAGMGVPFFQVVGNHDMDYEGRTDEASTATFSRHFGPRYYSFNRGAVHYVVLDDVFWHGAGYIGYLDADQLAWLEADLQFVEPGSPVVVVQHIPALGTGFQRRGEQRPGLGVSVANREVLYRLLEPFRAHILVGHTHENEHLFRNGVHEFVCGTVCGAWWSGPICADGTPSGYAVIEVAGEEISWRYKATREPPELQMRTYSRGSDPRAPNEIVANIWDWDPEWRVVWHEAGDRRGPMARRTGLDPLSGRLHTGPDLPPRRPWVDPYPTNHLFYAPVAADASDIRVEATDRFGRTYAMEVPAA
jgi:hypothetical protein